MEEFTEGGELQHLRLSQLSAQFHTVLVLDDYNLEYGVSVGRCGPGRGEVEGDPCDIKGT